jgi:hypothetical protein
MPSSAPCNACRDMFEPGRREREASAMELFRAAIPLRQCVGAFVLDHQTGEGRLHAVQAVDFYREGGDAHS